MHRSAALFGRDEGRDAVPESGAFSSDDDAINYRRSIDEDDVRDYLRPWLVIEDKLTLEDMFQKGNKLGSGRPKGVPNKTTVALKEAIFPLN
jgi:hypothetical protein